MLNILCYTFVGNSKAGVKTDAKAGAKADTKVGANPCAEPFLPASQWIYTVKKLDPRRLMDMEAHHFMGSNWVGTKVFEIADLDAESGVPIFVKESVYGQLKSHILPYMEVF